MSSKIEELKKLYEQALLGGGKEAIDAQHSRGKLTARERVELLVDSESFLELDIFVRHRTTEFGMDKRWVWGDAVVTGLARIGGRRAVVIAQDFTFMGGSLGEMHAAKIVKAMQTAISQGIPIVFLNDSGGARIQEGVDSLRGYGDIFYMNVMASGIVPQIAAIMGPCAGGAVYSPALMDFVVMVKKTSFMFITGPRVVRAAIGEVVDEQQLGGPEVHAAKSGQADFIVEDDKEAIAVIKKLLSYLPSNNMEDPPVVRTGDLPDRDIPELDGVVPEDPNAAYDMYKIVDSVLDVGSFLEVKTQWARNAITGFGRLDGRSVCIIANQPNYLAGVLDIDSSDKIAEHVRFCDAFNIPIVTFVDVPGYMPGTKQEHGGIIRHGAKVLYAYSEATVPKLTIIVRKAYGGAYIAMGSKHLGADFVAAWPTAEIAVMGPEGAAEIIWRRELEAVKDPQERAKLLAKFTEEYRSKFANPYVAASRGYVDSVIQPRNTRRVLTKALEILSTKREVRIWVPPKKHGLTPI
ncbi:MAG: acyl-CoA carboxylase subunit beta [Sulfolobales archaeon]|nr:acyl-CoA carboxylase subunit beta [Sulfolobales archaeon]MDW8082858.1 acyl-CoA carboxylase subunit beta [Sulfolobales archaeon]